MENADLATLGRREWLLKTRADLRALSSEASAMPAYETISARDFLHRHYAPNRPALIRAETAGWPALKLWTPEYLKAKIGSTKIEYQGSRNSDADYELMKQRHRHRVGFDKFIDMALAEGAANDVYVTAYNSRYNTAALAPLTQDLGFIDHILERNVPNPYGMMWIGGGGTFTPLHHDLTNNLLVQIVGSKRIVLISPDEVTQLYNNHHVFSQILDVEKVDLTRFPATANLRVMRFDLMPGEALFIPIGWWHQVTSNDFSVSITYTNFRWRNNFHESFPS